jgi:glycogenin glucosyltransferase
MKNAYVTYLSTDSYLMGVLALRQSWLASGSKYPFYCLVTKEVSDSVVDDLKSRGVKIIKTPLIELPKNLTDYNDKYCYAGQNVLKNYFNKLVIFALDSFDKIIYLDADMIILDNIDELFDRPHMTAVLDHAEGDRYFFNSAIMVIEPSRDLFKHMMKELAGMSEHQFYLSANKDHKCLWDQDYLNLYYSDWKSNPERLIEVKYNAFRDAFNGYNIPMSSVKVAHMVAKKPWEMNLLDIYDIIMTNENGSGYFFKKYLEFLMLEMGE